MKQDMISDRRKIVVFEDLSDGHRWLVGWHRLKNTEIRFMRINEFAKDKEWIKMLIGEGIFKKIEPSQRMNMVDGVDCDAAYDAIDHFYKVVEKNNTLKFVIKVYRDSAIALVFKKTLHGRLKRFYYLNRVMHDLQLAHDGQKIIFVPSLSEKLYRRADGCDIYDYRKFYDQAQSIKATYGNTQSVKFSFGATLLSYIYTLKRKIETILQVGGFLFIILFMSAKNLTRKRAQYRIKKSNYKYAIMIVSPKRQFSNRIQKVDFLIDGETIKKDDVLFLSCARLKDEYSGYLDGNGFQYVDDIDRYFSISRPEIFTMVKAYLLMAIGSLAGDCMVAEEAMKALYLYLRWTSFSKKVRIEKLISHSDSGIQSIARNIILKKTGCESYYYMDTTNFSFFYARAGASHLFRDDVYSFMYYDYLVAWNKITSDYFKKARCSIKKYLDAGCFWSEHLKSIEKGAIDSTFIQDLHAHGYDNKNMKLISIFDSGYHAELIFNYDDGIQFLKDILRLLADMPHIFIVLKEKLPRDYHKKVILRYKEILKLYETLEAHPRCYSIKRWENSSEIMAFNDLTISFPFTSSTVEAISTRKRAIWYDATGKFRNTFYDSIPHLVCHGYEELHEQVGGLLKMTDEDYSRYLDACVKGKIEEHLDGNAISRFRSFLSEGVEIPWYPSKARRCVNEHY